MLVDPPGPRIGQGRAADVYDAGPGRVLRRYRTEHDCVPEADLLTHLHRHGYPVPEVFDADGRDILMARVEGPVQLEDLERRPWRVHRHGRLLASLHDRLDAIPPPDPSPVGVVESGAGRHGVLHLDLHPGNVILSPDGPVVIDWTNARVGARSFDVATTWMLLATGEPPGGPAMRVVVAAMRRRLLGAFLGAVDRDAARDQLVAVCERRLADPNLLPGEAVSVRTLARSVRG